MNFLNNIILYRHSLSSEPLCQLFIDCLTVNISYWSPGHPRLPGVPKPSILVVLGVLGVLESWSPVTVHGPGLPGLPKPSILVVLGVLGVLESWTMNCKKALHTLHTLHTLNTLHTLYTLHTLHILHTLHTLYTLHTFTLCTLCTLCTICTLSTLITPHCVVFGQCAHCVLDRHKMDQVSPPDF